VFIRLYVERGPLYTVCSPTESNASRASRKGANPKKREVDLASDKTHVARTLVAMSAEGKNN
jgi:hypothetical protein